MSSHTLDVLEYHGYVTWEVAQTRKYRLGRTEVIRPSSIEALEWCKAMENDEADWRGRLERIQLAVEAHLAYAKDASEGKGIDRHLLGLRLLLKPGEELPTLFQDPVYKESTRWILATSNLPSENFYGFGFGAVEPEGFGLAYPINKDFMRFTITTPTSSSVRLKNCLKEAADDILKMMDVNKGKGPATVKL
ncbi:hypothetical protein PCANC_12412 [Puccinia coronata f. sp. avenae]|uniref:Choline/carnitine acyltransferase domain-containing protein n=1 Tax=Puccinia coronata f. sp. avenae TaxID=200324 RepID=A0A2N5VB43_9BASI|nr:hypothetical protein PCANC_12412 [Puccinia coronata f. sp. avenae]